MINWDTAEKQYSGTGRSRVTSNIVTPLEITAAIPIRDFKSISAEGTCIECRSEEHFKRYWRKAEKIHPQYSAYLSSEIGKPFLFIKGTRRVVGTWIPQEKGFYLMLSSIVQLNQFKTKKAYREACSIFIDALLDLISGLKKTSGDYLLPEWSKKYLLPDEQNIRNTISKKENELNQVLIEISQKKEGLANIERYKLLLFGQGTALEKQVAQVLEEIGFNVIRGENNRKDLQIEYSGKVAVVEVKGVEKSGKEAHSRQLETWVSEYFAENEGVESCKGIMFLNAYCKDPLEERDSKTIFPKSMVDYSSRNQHCLMTTTQLLGIYLTLKKDSSHRDRYIDEIFKTIGVYPNFSDYREYIGIEEENAVTEKNT